MIAVDISEWRHAEINADAERLFVVGDVHGCSAQLAAWLEACAAVRSELHARERLVFVGDIINGGPDTAGAVELWSRRSPVPGITRIHRLMGNHEQLHCLAERPSEPVSRELETAVSIDNLTLVHAGSDPHSDVEAFLALGADVVPEDDFPL